VPADTYLVSAGDDLWTVSERVLGDGRRWRDLAAANPDTLTDPTTRLTPGTRLALPADAGRAPRRVTVERGDTLSGLALEHLGAAGRWPRIAAENRDLIDDPDHIEVGWRLDLPEPLATSHRVSPRHPGQASEPGQAPDPGAVRGPAPASPSPDATPPEAPSTSAGPRSGPDDAAPPPSVPSPAQTAAPLPASTASPADPAPRPVQSTAAETPPPAVAAPAGDEHPGLPGYGVFGSLAAAAILGAVETRRFLRLRERPVGRRFLSPEESELRLRAALGVEQRPDRLEVLDAALRAIGRDCHVRGVPLPELERITVGAQRIAFAWAAPAGQPPAGFGGAPDCWTVELASAIERSTHPCPYPAVVSLGTAADDSLVLVDLERSRVLGVASPTPELSRASMASMAVELACAPWSADVTLVVAGADAGLARLAGGERVQVVAGADELRELARSVVVSRRTALAAEPLSRLRVDPDRADAVAPVVLCLLGEAPPELAGELDDLLAGPPCGVAAIVATPASTDAQWQVGGDADAPRGRLAGAPGQLFAHAIPEATRAGVSALFRAADDPTTTPAPWWGGSQGDNVVALPSRTHPGGDDVDIVRLVPATGHPQVLLIGPAELRGASGPEPARSRQQLVELCAWLLEHPGSTATAMATGLAVAEGTRRSNLSRLRAWLGSAPDGSLYLPDAYSGHVLLHPDVTSDWQRLHLLLAPGIDKVGDNTLVAALDLVRGAPLADAAPGQWHWAEELRTDLACALRDVGVVLAERALARGDIDLARWAASRALVAAAEDEQLLCARIRTEHRAGNTAEVERLVNHVTRQARLLGVDLLPETVQLCQQAIEGRVRARA
jgi:hypothetical protein